MFLVLQCSKKKRWQKEKKRKWLKLKFYFWNIVWFEVRNVKEREDRRERKIFMYKPFSSHVSILHKSMSMHPKPFIFPPFVSILFYFLRNHLQVFFGCHLQVIITRK